MQPTSLQAIPRKCRWTLKLWMWKKTNQLRSNAVVTANRLPCSHGVSEPLTVSCRTTVKCQKTAAQCPFRSAVETTLVNGTAQELTNMGRIPKQPPSTSSRHVCEMKTSGKNDLLCLSNSHYPGIHQCWPTSSSAAPPVVKVDPESVNAEEGDRVALKCSSSSQPPPTFSWGFKTPNGALPGNVMVTPDGATMIIPKCQKDHAGNWFCTGTNKNGNDTKAAIVNTSTCKCFSIMRHPACFPVPDNN